MSILKIIHEVSCQIFVDMVGRHIGHIHAGPDAPLFPVKGLFGVPQIFSYTHEASIPLLRTHFVVIVMPCFWSPMGFQIL